MAERWIFLIAAVLLSGCGERWEPVVYENAGDTFGTRLAQVHGEEQCRAAVRRYSEMLNEMGRDTSSLRFECGRDCWQYDAMQPDISVCQATVD